MVLGNIYSKEEKENLYKMGVIIEENKDYTPADCRMVENKIGEFIISQSIKTGKMDKAKINCDRLLRKINY